VARGAAVVLSGLLIALALVAGAAAGEKGAPVADRRIMPLAEVQAGMKGTGLTVIHGTTVEPFDVEVLGVMPGAGPEGELILVRVGGPVIDQTGGIAAGMSGSPVYVDGRLLGAVSYGFSFSDHRIGFLTPIERMLPVLDQARIRGGDGPDEAKPLPEMVTAGEPATQLATPLFVSGADERVFRRLAGLVSPLGYRAELGGRSAGTAGGAGDGAGAAGKAALEPGSAFGAALVTGDMSVTAIGTVTYTEGAYFLGFGHPFLNKGRVGLPVSLAEIFQTVKSEEAPFKLGAPLQPVGTLLEDRPTGVAGKLGSAPEGIEVKVKVEDVVRHEKTSFTTRVVPDEALAGDLIGLSALQGMDRGLARIGRGTAEVRLALRGDGLPGGTVARENLFYSAGDVGAAALRDLLSGVALVVANPFRSVALRQVELTARVGEERRTGVIEKVRLVKEGPVRPGDSAELEVLVRPYRGEAQRERLLLPIPEGTASGPYTVAVHGGGTSGAPDEDQEVPAAEDGHAPNPEKVKKAPGKAQEPKTSAESLEALLDQFVRQDRNNELVAELANAQDEEGAEGAVPAKPAGHPPVRRAAKGSSPAAQADRSAAKGRLTLPYVVLGSAQVELEVGLGGTQEFPLKNPPAPRWDRPRRDP
jgi:hypothetical protein